eukprot:3331412-Rhodomonas_salina.5
MAQRVLCSGCSADLSHATSSTSHGDRSGTSTVIVVASFLFACELAVQRVNSLCWLLPPGGGGGSAVRTVRVSGERATLRTRRRSALAAIVGKSTMCL